MNRNQLSVESVVPDNTVIAPFAWEQDKSADFE